MKHSITLLLLKIFFLHSIAQTNFTQCKVLWNETDSTFHIVQDERIGWEISGNFGAYFANKYQAKFYDGRKENKNNIDYIFNNKYWKQEIIHLLDANVHRDSFQIYQLPADMKYEPSMYVGFSARYNHTKALAFNIHFNYTKLQTKDMLTLKLFPPLSGQIESFEYCGLYGTEQRTNIDIGIMYDLQADKPLSLITEFGININNTLVKSHTMRLYEREFNMVNIYLNNSYIPNTQQNEYNIRQGGIGFGMYASIGARYKMNKQFTLELVSNQYLKTINLEGYNKRLGIHIAPMFRLVFSPFFNFELDDNDY